jgi:low affinity Fe/Cu permease
VVEAITDVVGHPLTLLIVTIAILCWPIFDRPFDFLDAVSALTAWLLFVLQASQNRLSREWTAELRELVRATPEAREEIIKEHEQEER